MHSTLITAMKQFIWHALRIHKEAKKHELVSEELEERVKPAINHLRQELEDIATEALKRFKLRRL